MKGGLFIVFVRIRPYGNQNIKDPLYRFIALKGQVDGWL